MRIGGGLVRLVQQARRLVVKRGRQFVSQKVRERFLNTIDAVVGKIRITFENVGCRLQPRKEFRQNFDLDRMIVTEAVIVGIKNLHLREVQQCLD